MDSWGFVVGIKMASVNETKAHCWRHKCVKFGKHFRICSPMCNNIKLLFLYMCNVFFFFTSDEEVT